MLDYHYSEVMDKTEKQKKQKLRILNRIKRNLNRQYTFHYSTKHAGKEVRGSLKRVHTVDQNQKIV